MRRGPGPTSLVSNRHWALASTSRNQCLDFLIFKGLRDGSGLHGRPGLLVELRRMARSSKGSHDLRTA